MHHVKELVTVKRLLRVSGQDSRKAVQLFWTLKEFTSGNIVQLKISVLFSTFIHLYSNILLNNTFQWMLGAANAGSSGKQCF